MPSTLLPLPTGPINASSANIQSLLLLQMAQNLAGSSGGPGVAVFNATSATLAAGYISNIINSSAMSGSSANTFGGVLYNLLASTAGILQATSSTLYGNQLVGASSAIQTLLLQNQLGFKISS